MYLFPPLADDDDDDDADGMVEEVCLLGMSINGGYVFT
jgi:hypothetical protein